MSFVPFDKHTDAQYLAHGAAADIWRISEGGPTSAHGYKNQCVHKVLRVNASHFELAVSEAQSYTKLWQDFLRNYCAQVSRWEPLRHEHVVRVLGLGSGLNLRVEYCQRGCLREYLKASPTSYADKLDIISHVLKGLSYLHSRSPHPIVHGNLNTGKLFIDATGTVKIGEFGLAALCHSFAAFAPSVSFVGLSRWLSPELISADLDAEIEPTTASDIWALGCVLFEIADGAIPYSTYKHDMQVQRQILAGEYPGQCNGLFKDQPFNVLWPVLESCWNVLPEQRVSIREILGMVDQVIPGVSSDSASGLAGSSGNRHARSDGTNTGYDLSSKQFQLVGCKDATIVQSSSTSLHSAADETQNRSSSPFVGRNDQNLSSLSGKRTSSTRGTNAHTSWKAPSPGIVSPSTTSSQLNTAPVAHRHTKQTPTHKNLYGVNLPLPSLPELSPPLPLNSTRLKGGASGSKVPGAVSSQSLHQSGSGNITPNLYPSYEMPRKPQSYAEALRKGANQKPVLPPAETQATTPEHQKLPSTDGSWTVVRHRRKIKGQHTASIPVPIASKAHEQGKGPKLFTNHKGKTVRVSDIHGAQKRPEPCDRAVECPYDQEFFTFLLKHSMSREVSDTLKQFFGFGGPVRTMKLARLEKAFKFIGLQHTRPAKGSAVTYTPTLFTGKASITFHWSHGGNVEDVERRNKAQTFKKIYPLAFNAFKKYWQASTGEIVEQI